MKYYKGEFSDYFTNKINIYTIDKGEIIRRTFDPEFGPIHCRYETNDQIDEWLKDHKCVEIDNGEELCSQFDALENSWNNMVDSYDKMFKHILND